MVGFGGGGTAALLLGEKRVQDVLRDGRRVRAMNAMLEEHHAGYLRIVARSEEDEPAVVAQLPWCSRGRSLPALEITWAVPVLPDDVVPLDPRVARAGRR